MDRKMRIAKKRDKVKRILLFAVTMLFITLLQSQVLLSRNLADNNQPIKAATTNNEQRTTNTVNALVPPKAGHSDTAGTPQNGRRDFKPLKAPDNKRGHPLTDIHFKNIRTANKKNTHRPRVKDTHNFVPTGRSLPSLGGRVESMRTRHQVARSRQRRTKTLTPRFDKGDGSPRRPLPLKNPAPAFPDARRGDGYDWLDMTIEKIQKIESGNKSICPDGDNGRAAGPMQIHKSAVDDVNKYYGKRFIYADRHNPDKAKQITKLYIAMWMETHKEEIACRIFNGGPRGWQKAGTDEYWDKIVNSH